MWFDFILLPREKGGWGEEGGDFCGMRVRLGVQEFLTNSAFPCSYHIKGSKERLFIRTQTDSLQIFGVLSFVKLRNNTYTTVKRLKFPAGQENNSSTKKREIISLLITFFNCNYVHVVVMTCTTIVCISCCSKRRQKYIITHMREIVTIMCTSIQLCAFDAGKLP